MSNQKFRVASLFCGAGGLDLGFIDAGFEIVYAADWDKDSCKTYRKNIGNYVVQKDISGLQAMEIPECDVVIGGPPCQGFSVAGRMDPNDPRSKMVWHFVRIVSEIQPKAFVMENVKSLAALSRWKNVREALHLELGQIGYHVRMFILNAADYGVPQSRERMFFVGTGERLPYVLKIDRELNKKVTTREVLSILPKPGEHPNLGVCRAKVTPAKKPVLRKSPFAGMLFNGQGRPIDLDSTANTLPATMGGNRTPIVDELELRDGKPSWVKQYHKHLTKGEPPAKKTPSRLRRITSTEAALLQAFPLGFKFSGSQCSTYRQIGNAVPPPLGKAVALALIKSLSGKQTKLSRNEQMVFL